LDSDCTMDKIKIGLIGLGSITEKVHIKNLKKIKDVSIKAVVDTNVDRAKAFAKEHDIQYFYTDAYECLHEIPLDGVIICTPNSTHMPIAKAAAEKNVHVFIEKPIGTHTEEVEDFLNIAKENGVKTMVGMPYRFRRDVEIARNYIESGRLGDIYYAKVTHHRQRGTPKGWFTDKTLSGGGVLMDIGVHMLDVTWFLLGEQDVHSVSGHAVNGLGNYETKYISSWESADKSDVAFDVDDFSSAWIRFKNGSVLSLETSWAVNGKQSQGLDIQLFGTKGGLSLSPLTIYEEEDNILIEKHPTFDETNMFYEEMDHFIKAIEQDQEPAINGRQGYEVLRMLEAIYESSKNKSEVIF